MLAILGDVQRGTSQASREKGPDKGCLCKQVGRMLRAGIPQSHLEMVAVFACVHLLVLRIYR